MTSNIFLELLNFVLLLTVFNIIAPNIIHITFIAYIRNLPNLNAKCHIFRLNLLLNLYSMYVICGSHQNEAQTGMCVLWVTMLQSLVHFHHLFCLSFYLPVKSVACLLREFWVLHKRFITFTWQLILHGIKCVLCSVHVCIFRFHLLYLLQIHTHTRTTHTHFPFAAAAAICHSNQLA